MQSEHCKVSLLHACKEKKMDVMVLIDSFKGSMTSMEAGNAARDGVLRVYPHANVTVRPLADGGEGTTDALIEGLGGRKVELSVTGPMGSRVKAYYGILADEKTAVMEMAQAAGITLVEEAQRNPGKATTYGVGEMIRDAVSRGCRKFIIGIGGSATNDGGIGMLQALGFGLLDAEGKQVPFGAVGLESLTAITADHVLPELSECTFRIACDVTNPLCGSNGCSAVFGPQKGADAVMIKRMDTSLASYAALCRKTFPNVDAEFPGTGAAGGLGFAFQTFLSASLEPGIQIILDETRLRDDVRDADLVITGEGQLDGQTVMGKAPIGVAKLSKEYGKPVLAFSGCVTKDASACNAAGIDAFFPILRSVVSLEEAMDVKNAAENMTDTVEQAFRLFLLQ